MPRFDLPRCAYLILNKRCCLPERHSGDHLWVASEDVQWDLYEALAATEQWWLTEQMQKGTGAPVCIFMARAALAKARGESVPVQSPSEPPATPKLPASFDAKDWAEGFVRMVRWKPSIATDEATMLTWFESAIMAGYDHARRSAVQSPGDQQESNTGAQGGQNDFVPPRDSSEFRHPYKIDPETDLCLQCGAGKLHAIHQGGRHAR